MNEPEIILYSKLSNDYIRFGLLRLGIFFALIVSIFNCTDRLHNFCKNDSDVDKVIAIQENMHLNPKYDDSFLDELFAKSSTYNSRVIMDSIELGACYTNGNEIDSQKLKDYAQAQLDYCYSRVIQASDESFTIKLAYFSDLTINLKKWLALFPFLFVVTTTYLNIIKYKIQFIQINIMQNNANVNSKNLRYPYVYLKGLYALLDFSLLILFLGWITMSNFINYSDSVDFFRLLFVMIYFYFVYDAYVCKQLLGEQFEIYVTLKVLISTWQKTLQFLRRTIDAIGYWKIFKMASIFLILTLVITMSHDGCSNKNYNGYEILKSPLQNKWSNGDAGSDLDIILQIIYCFSFIMAILSAVFFLLRKGVNFSHDTLPRIFLFYYSLCLIIFSISFSFANSETSYVALWMILSVVFIYKWVINIRGNHIGNKHFTYKIIAENLLIICVPFFILTLLNFPYYFVNIIGYIFFFFSLLASTASFYTFVLQAKSTNN